MKIKNKSMFAKGHRGIIYLGELGNKKVAIKVERKESEAIERISNEARFLKLLNKYKIGPRYICFENGELVYEFFNGERILDFWKRADKKDKESAAKKILQQCRSLDKLNINKEEMHNPYKHILVRGKKVVMIDFERAHKTIKPKNVSQFCQFMSKRLGFKVDMKKFVKLLREYRKSYSENDFKRILKLFF